MRATPEELIAHTRGVAGGVKKVTRVEILEALPRTATGKVQRNVLKAPHWAGRATRISGS
jgi:acyl-coenzyme A synthetase/AMP-(fatty) acid ligase